MNRSPAILALALLVPGCLTADGPDLAEQRAAILGGEADFMFPSVCGMLIDPPLDEDGMEQDQIRCTCTLVEACTILTSARCVSQNVDLLDDIDVRFNQSFTAGVTLEVEKVELYRYFSEDGARVSANELALLRLATCPEEDPVDILDRPLVSGDVARELTLVGYGETIEGGSQGSRTRNATPITQVAPRHVVAGTDEVTSCAGDSGGPGFLDDGGGPVLATMNPLQGTCNPSVQRLRLDRFTDTFLFPFIDRYSGPCALDGACVTSCPRSPDPDCDPCLWQGTGNSSDCATDCPTRDWDCEIGRLTGQGCDDDGDCEEGGHCVPAADDPSFTYCSRGCDPADSADCPAGMQCSSTGAGMECVWGIPSPGSQGYACTINSDCRSNICEGGICVFQCGEGSSCPAPYLCGESEVAPGMLVCLGENLEGGGGFCAVGGADGRGWPGLLALLAAVPLVLRRRWPRQR